jgi:hypothetical protein
MVSQLKKGNWRLYEGDFWADVMGNKNDPRFATAIEALLRGERMRGDAFIITLESDSDNVETIRSAELFVVSSENTSS